MTGLTPASSEAALAMLYNSGRLAPEISNWRLFAYFVGFNYP
jgi:hypothetical protein